MILMIETKQNQTKHKYKWKTVKRIMCMYRTGQASLDQHLYFRERERELTYYKIVRTSGFSEEIYEEISTYALLKCFIQGTNVKRMSSIIFRRIIKFGHIVWWSMEFYVNNSKVNKCKVFIESLNIETNQNGQWIQCTKGWSNNWWR